MLDADEVGALVAGPGLAGDFGTLRGSQEALDAAGGRVARQHLVVALAGEVAFIAILAVGLDPEQTSAIEHHAVRRVEHVAFVDVRRTRIGVLVDGGVAGHAEQVPLELAVRMVVIFRIPAHDLAVFVLLARVGGIGRHGIAAGIGAQLAVLHFAAAAVVGQRAIGFDGDRVDGDPFRAVHRRCTDLGSGLSGEDADFVDLHARGFRGQGQPLAGAVIGELGDVKRAFVKQLGGVAARHVDAVGDEFIEEFATLVVTHVNNDTAVTGNHHGGVFMLDAAKRGALDRGGLGVRRIDLDHITGAARFVGVLGDVETLVKLLIGITRLGHDAITLVIIRQLEGGVGGAEIAVEVLFAGEVGAPRCAAGAAIVEGPETVDTIRVGGGLDEIGACSRAGKLHWCVVVDTAVEGAVENDLPAVLVFRNFHDGDALHVLQDLHIVGRLRVAFFSVRQVGFRVHIFVVDGDQLMAADHEKFHTVGVFAEDLVGIFNADALGGVEIGNVGEQRLAPFRQRLPVIAFRDMDGVVGCGGNRLERETAGGGFVRLRRSAAQQVAERAHGGRGRTEGQHAAEKAAAGNRGFNHAVEIGFGRRRVLQFVPLVPGQFARIDVGHSLSPPFNVWNHSNRLRTFRVFHSDDGKTGLKYDLLSYESTIFPSMREKDASEQQAFEAAEAEGNLRSAAPVFAEVGRQAQ
ncbi:hypothetical protein D3C80_457390 [compost metagenome]